jgi:hypothetical protein
MPNRKQSQFLEKGSLMNFREASINLFSQMQMKA